MDKERARLEILAYRIIRRHFKKIVQSIPMGNMSKATYEALIYGNVQREQIVEMYKDLYNTIGYKSYKSTLRQVKLMKDLSELSFEKLVNDFLMNQAGLRITSVHSTLIQSIIDVIATGFENNLSVEQITRLLQNQFNWNKIQALRIARTETTTIVNSSTVLAANESKYELDKVWISVQDNRTRRPPESIYDHLDMNGVKVDYDNTFFVSGIEMEYPGDPSAPAGTVINCRCKIAVVLKEDADGLPILKIN